MSKDKGKIITEEEIRKRLDDLHHAENKLNKRITNINWEVSLLEKEKKKLAAKVANNMRHRNILINKLPNSEQEVKASVATEDDSSTGDDNQKT